MPGQDGTGPNGEGPLTGRGLGRCNSGKGFTRFGRGFGRGFGREFSPRWGLQNVQLSKEQKKKILEAELAEIEAEKKEIENQMKEFK